MSDMKNEKETMKTNVEILADVMNVPTEYIISEIDGTPETVHVKEALTAMDKVREQMQGRMDELEKECKRLRDQINDNRPHLDWD